MCFPLIVAEIGVAGTASDDQIVVRILSSMRVHFASRHVYIFRCPHHDANILGVLQNNLGVASDPAREALFDEIERQLRLKRRRREPGARRVTVTVSDEVFSAVSYLAYARDMDKVEVLTFLLQLHLPAAEIDTIPAWLMKSALETTKKECHLSFFEDLDVKGSLAWLELRFELYKVDVVESIVQRYLPTAPFLVRPKRKLKAVEARRTDSEIGWPRTSKNR